MASNSLKVSLLTLFIFALIMSPMATLPCDAARAPPPGGPAPTSFPHPRIPIPICPRCLCCAPPPAPGKCCPCFCPSPAEPPSY
ncbi:uncharacterized protein LOC129290639 [Prosopis cineraria]|uniref:uncharacterized protein LOC129290580 n=1 Tax=Prosopis cineraria TaxID=364024 RepID=UPI002410A837|nr:uncharacterized protein LOC129290580 [Prosopis cineraria]XP_054783440.1 uncharacterized protein LOC129290639 [Prosopis cineraria]